MPSARRRADFVPIHPSFDLNHLVENTPNFQYVDRISCDMIDQQGMAEFEKLVLLHVVVGGKPLVIDGYEDRLDPWTFAPKWLRDNCGDKVERARDLLKKDDLPLTIGHYLKNMGLLTNQFFDKPGAWEEKNRQRVYLKDIDCPDVWWDKLKENLPAALTYLNESTGDIGGPGALPDPTSTTQGRRLGKGIARAGDLMSSLPPDMRAENLMCYIGHEGTYTPAHREMCASLGQNIMVEASNTVSDDGHAEKPGSSIWFMTQSNDRHMVSEHFLGMLGHDIEVENHFAQVTAWKRAPFNVYVVEQRPGDFILIPPLAPHQVWNRGTRTMKVAWNRTTVETLEMALNEALPRSRIVCREEQYKNKAIVYYTLQKYASLLTQALGQAARMPQHDAQRFLFQGKNNKVKQLQKDFRRLFNLYKQVLLSEMFSPEDRDTPKNLEYLPFDSNVTCAYCRGNIFNRFLSCPNCKDMLGHNAESEDGDPYDICMDCYAMGRSCYCISGLKWVEQFRWKELAAKYETWRKLIIQLDGGQQKEASPLTIIDERRRYGKKTLAEVCKEQLKRRPFKDIKKPVDEPREEESDEEIIVGDDGQVKKIQKKKSKTWLKNNQPCHVCCKRHPTWRMATCTTCERGWCYGSLFRGWDKMPLEIMQDPGWQCPHCLGICFAGACKKEGKMQPYEPRGTLLGHDTKKVADVRSVESLVDFSVSNLTWLRDDDPTNPSQSRRMQKARAEADQTTDHQMEDDDEDNVDQTQIAMEDVDDETLIDPALGGKGLASSRHRQANSDYSMSGALQDDIDEDKLARRLQQANASLPGPGAMVNGAPADADGDALLSGYAPAAQMYPQPDEDTPYVYPGQDREEDSLEPNGELQPFKKRRRTRGGDEDGDFEEISMTKSKNKKKPRLTAAGFRSFDLAGNAEGPMTSKAKNEVQRQFEKEKERKALEKAKAEGRFIQLQAALKGKRRVVVLKISRERLAEIDSQMRARETAQAALEAGAAAGEEANARHEVIDGVHDAENDKEEESAAVMLLKSDIAPKKTREEQRDQYEQKKRNGMIVSGSTKKALIPVDRDENYGHTYRSRLPVGKRGVGPLPTAAASKKERRRAAKQVEYEEVDVGSDNEEGDSSFVVINSTAKASRNRRSLPGYLQNRYEDNDTEVPNALPENYRDHRPARDAASHQRSSAVDEELQRETAASLSSTPEKVNSKVAGKRPSMRPSAAQAETIEILDDGTVESSDDDDDDDETQDMITQAANGNIGNEAPDTSWEKARGRSPKAESASKVIASSSNTPTRQARAQAQAAALEAQRIMEENRLAKLQALQMLEEGPSSNSGATDSFGSMRAGGNNVSIADAGDDVFGEDESDDDMDAVPARLTKV